MVDAADVEFWVTELFGSWIGDANLDGEFTSRDFVETLVEGKYEEDIDAVWSSGDFDGSGRFDSGDLVAAMSGGGYEQGPRATVRAVPESCSLTMFAMTLGLIVAWMIHAKQRNESDSVSA